MFTLVPSGFFDPAAERETLAEVANIEEGAAVAHADIPQYDAVLIYTVGGDSGVSDPEILNVLRDLPNCAEYNKILCSMVDGVLYLGIAQGRSLLLANSYRVQNFTSAEYFIFLAMKSLQLNPEVSTICWRTPLNSDDEMSLYRYFKAVEVL
ncbi:MAG: DUF3822 family protein [Bacteroidales bacterium]|nr:DUF3822 family protein [Candidatus Cryptobacteroides choladohippi]